MKRIYLSISSMLLVLFAVAQEGFKTANFRAERAGGSVRITWVGLNEANVESHEIERSNDGVNYRVIGSLNPINSHNTTDYSFIDGTPIQGTNYYRLRSTNGAGAVFYTNPFRMDMGYRKTSVNIYPNPTSTGSLRLQMENMPAGKYAIRVVNISGQVVYNQSLELSEGTATRFIELPNRAGSGMYIVQVANGELVYNKKFMVN